MEHKTEMEQCPLDYFNSENGPFKQQNTTFKWWEKIVLSQMNNEKKNLKYGTIQVQKSQNKEGGC